MFAVEVNRGTPLASLREVDMLTPINGAVICSIIDNVSVFGRNEAISFLGNLFIHCDLAARCTGVVSSTTVAYLVYFCFELFFSYSAVNSDKLLFFFSFCSSYLEKEVW